MTDIPPSAAVPQTCTPSAFFLSFQVAVELIGRRWSGAILRGLLSGRVRYTEIACAVPGLSDRLLSERLKEFEAECIITRVVIPDTPVRIEYRLTPKGAGLRETFEAVAAWADEWIKEGSDPCNLGGGASR
jgi:DNA-binding HxlR family transcriptional regulator